MQSLATAEEEKGRAALEDQRYWERRRREVQEEEEEQAAALVRPALAAAVDELIDMYDARQRQQPKRVFRDRPAEQAGSDGWRAVPLDPRYECNREGVVRTVRSHKPMQGFKPHPGCKHIYFKIGKKSVRRDRIVALVWGSGSTR